METKIRDLNRLPIPLCGILGMSLHKASTVTFYEWNLLSSIFKENYPCKVHAEFALGYG